MAVSRRQLIGDKVSGLCSGVSIVTGRATVFRVVKDAGPGKGRERGYIPLCHIVCTGGGGSFFPLCHIVCTGLGSGLRRYSKVPREPWWCTTRGQSDSFRPGHPGAYIGRRGPCQGPSSRRKQLKLGRSLWGLSLR